MKKRTKFYYLVLTLVISLSVMTTTGSVYASTQKNESQGVIHQSPQHSILPKTILGEWWWPWDPPTIGQVMKEAPQVNYLSIAGLGRGQNTGKFFTDFGMSAHPNYNDAHMIADIKAWEASGRVAVGMVGGGGDTTVINNETNVQEFMSTIIPIINKFHFQGIDFDLENTPNADCVVSIINQLKHHYGPGFIIAISPRPYELRAGGVYRAIIQKAGIGKIDLVQVQDYALLGDSLAQQRKYMDSDMSDWINNDLIPAKKILIGSYFPGDQWTHESAKTAVDTYTFYKNLYPTLRGAINWETRDDAANGWQFATRMWEAMVRH